MQVATQRKTVVDIDTRRSVFMVARARKEREVQKESHENFIRHALKERMGWPQREPAPESIKEVARQMASQLLEEQRAKEVADRAKRAAALKTTL